MSVYVLDTNIISFYMKGYEQVIRHVENALISGDDILIAPIAYYEIRRGLLAIGSEKRLQKFESLCNMFGIGTLENSILDIAADIYAALHKKGQSADDADIFIAAFCVRHGFSLVTNNTKHFNSIPDLALVDWTV